MLDNVYTDVWGQLRFLLLEVGTILLPFFWLLPSRTALHYVAKNEAHDAFLKWKKLIEIQRCCKIKWLRSKNGSEYKSNQFLKVLKIAYKFLIRFGLVFLDMERKVFPWHGRQGFSLVCNTRILLDIEGKRFSCWISNWVLHVH